MLIIDRQNRLMELLREKKSAQLELLAEALSVSSSTVRRDVEALEEQGLVARTHGGVILRAPHIPPAARNTAAMALEDRMHEQVEAKQMIAAAAGKLVEPGMTVYLDGGSTMHFVVGHITARPLQVVTNSLTVALRFAEDDRVELLVLGGSHYPRTGVLIGPITTQSLAGVHADLMLFSGAGLYDGHVYNSNLALAEVEKLAMRQAARKVLLMDSSKFGRKGLAHVCAVDDLDLIIADRGVHQRWRDAMCDKLRIAGEPS